MSFLYLPGLSSNLLRSASSVSPGVASAHSKFGTEYLYDGTPTPFKYASIASNEYVDIDLGSAQSVDFVAIIGHNFDFSNIGAVKLNSSDDNWSTSRTEITLNESTPTMYGWLSSPVSRQYWRVIVENTNSVAISIDELWLGLAGEANRAIYLPYEPEYTMPQRVSRTGSGQPFVENLSAYEIRSMSCEFGGPLSNFEEMLQMWRDSKWGKEPTLLVLDSEQPADAVMCKIAASLRKLRTKGGASYRFNFSFEEYPFSIEYE